MARLGDKTPQSISIVGERRVGKSSLLWHLSCDEVRTRYLDDPESYIFLYIDFQGQRHLDLEGFSRLFHRQLAEAVDGRVELSEASNLAELEACVQQLATAGLRLVGLFDEFETVTGSDAFGAEFFGFLRSLANSYPVAYVTASRRDLRSLCRSQEISESPFFNIFAQVSLGPLEPEEAQRLICEPSAAAGVSLAEHAEELRALGGYLPLFLQMACSAAFECRLEDDGYDAGRVERRFREEADAHLTYLWEHLADDERQVMQTLMSEHEPAVEAQATLRRLETMGCVVREGTRVRPFTRSLAAVLAEGGVVETGAVPANPVELSESAPKDAPAAAAGTHEIRLQPVSPDRDPFPRIIGRSLELRRVFAFIERAAASNVTVLLLGDTGTGKELVARTIHDHSERRDAPFVVVNCGAIAEHLQESELFGHRKGAFTDAIADRQGLFEAAHGGTLLLDEIAETTPSTQVKLLRVLQEREVRRVGETEPVQVDVRVIGATNRDLETEVAAGRFREDLYYRLSVLVSRLPPLRDRRDDIPQLVAHFLGDRQATSEVMGLLAAYDWPGNVRELENQLAAACAVAGDAQIRTEHLWSRLQSLRPVERVQDMSREGVGQSVAWSNGMSLRQARESFERDLLAQRLRQFDGDHIRVADSLSVFRSRLYELIRKYGLRTDD
jgi:two-component system response regulator AtoC